MAIEVAYRETKYCRAIRRAMKTLDHPTNVALLTSLRAEFPDLSATTVHRATARLAERGEIRVAPSTKQGAVRYDSLTTEHDHFNCTICDKLCDAELKEKILPIITSAVIDCSISGDIIINGICGSCSKAKNQGTRIQK